MQNQITQLVNDVGNFETLLAILLYLAIFGWIGWRRGWRSELIVFIVAVGGWYLLVERGRNDIVNFTVKLSSVAGSLFGAGTSTTGGASGLAAALQAQGASAAQREAIQRGFVFLIWAGMVFLTYVLTSIPRLGRGSKRNFWAVLLGVLNGYFFLYVTLPGFERIAKEANINGTVGPFQSLFNLIMATLGYLGATLSRIWQMLQPVNPLLILGIIIVILTLAAISLQRKPKAKPKS